MTVYRAPAVRDDVAGDRRRICAVGLARDQVEGADRRRSEVRAVRIVTHREVLCIVPQGGHRVAVVVTHGEARRAEDAAARGRRTGHADRGREQVHQAVIEGELLRAVVVILVGGDGLRSIQAERIGSAEHIRRVQLVRIGREQPARERVGGGRVGIRLEPGLPARVERVWIRAEVMIERDVFVEDDDDVTNDRAVIAILVGSRGGRQQHGRTHCQEAGKHPLAQIHMRSSGAAGKRWPYRRIVPWRRDQSVTLMSLRRKSGGPRQST